jgi:hypothetical protein
MPWYVRKRHGFAYRWCNVKRRLQDMMCTTPQHYAVYMPGEEARRKITIKHPTCVWGLRMEGEA